MKPERVLYITGETAYEYRWQHKQLVVHRFSLNQAPQLQHHLSYHSATTLLLIDLPILELRTDSLPAVRGENLRQLRARRLERFFPGSVYCNALSLCPDPHDENRQLWLFHGLALPEGLEPWLSAARASTSPLAGMSAFPLFVTRILNEIPHPEQLLLAIATPAGWRLIYVFNGKLLFSRLLPIEKTSQTTNTSFTTDIQDQLNEEIERTRQYLVAQRWLPYNETLQVWVTPLYTQDQIPITDNAVPSPVPFADVNKPSLHITHFPLKKLIPSLSETLPQAEGFHDWVIYQILRHWPLENHYAPVSLRDRFLGKKLRIAAVGFGLCGLLAGMGSATLAMLEQQELEHELRLVNMDQRYLQKKYSVAIGLLPDLPLPAPSLQARIETFHAIEAQHAPIRQWLVPLSRALTTQPEIELLNIRWKSDATSPTKLAKGQLWNIVIEMRILQNRNALQISQIIERMQKKLEEEGFVANVLRSPLNFNPATTLRSQLQRQPNNSLRPILNETEFSLELKWFAQEAK